MPYTLWYNHQCLGQTEFEIPGRNTRQRAGVFRPDPAGAPLLPAITSVHRAVTAFENLIKDRKLTRDEMLDCMATTPEGQRVAECGEVISQLKLRDPAGAVVQWKTIAILDLEEIGHENLRRPARMRVGKERFMISATMKRPQHILH